MAVMASDASRNQHDAEDGHGAAEAAGIGLAALRRMASSAKDDFVGRHLIVDASTFTRRNLSSTDTVFALFEALNRSLDMTAVLPPIVCRYPFANDELAAFCDDIEAELEAKARELAARSRKPVDLSLAPVRVMRDFLRRRTRLYVWKSYQTFA
jgi:hypothetical protein